ncbi:hypothetical protein [Mycetocola saprophilus]|uniref:hypothetical protein n=1 Tax=Mycetocola saprophilus TaxID=76636 RepID=UPI0004BFE4D1|nr:hypothetical protein [Mycetocola saprophilus]
MSNIEKPKTLEIPRPTVAPLGVEVTVELVQDVWDTFIKPTQNDDAPPQSAETRVLMGILRAVAAGFDAEGVPSE